MTQREAMRRLLVAWFVVAAIMAALAVRLSGWLG